MRILFTRFPLESAYGGAEVQTLSLIKGLQEKGHEVSFLGSCETLLSKCKERGIKHQELHVGKPPVTKWGAVSFFWRQRKMKKKLIKSLKVKSSMLKGKSEKTFNLQPSTFNIIFMLSLTEKLLLTDWATGHGIKVFWIEHDRLGRWLTKNPWLPKLRNLSQKVTTIVVSDLSRDIYLKLGWNPEKVVSIPNGIDVEKFSSEKRKVRSEKLFKIGCISRLTYDKGVDLLIDAVAELPNVSLDIVGTGKEEQNLRKQINQLTNKPINLTPTVDPATFYRSIDCLVLPSREHDPFGLVVAEAMAAGVPTIVTDACGIARHLAEDEAIIVPAGNVAALREAIIEVQKEEKWLSLAKKGPEIAEKKFSVEKMVEVYNSLL